MKQTAVDILYKFLYEMESFEGFDPYSFNQKDVFEQAKKLEKEQIMRTARQCYFEGVRKRAKTTEELIEYAEQYYNETFKQQEQ